MPDKSQASAAVPPGKIVHVKIFPPIGIARAGDSKESYIGPEVPDKEPRPDGTFRDALGGIKRQAVRFRAYAFDANGVNLGEITKQGGYTLEWTVQVANKKAAWVVFRGIDEQETFELRNAGVQPYEGASLSKQQRYEHTETRDKLIARSGPQTVGGGPVDERKTLNAKFQGDTEIGHDVCLGEIYADADGRLVVLAGNGKSFSVRPIGDSEINSDFDNANWIDDMGDGPVTVAVSHSSNSGEKWEAKEAKDRAHVVMSPPKFTTGMHCFTSLYDLIEDTYEKPKRAQLGGAYDCGTVYYDRHIEPIFKGVYMLSWTSQKVHDGHGPHKIDRFFGRDELSDPNKPGDMRQDIFQRIRAPVQRDIPDNKFLRTEQAFEYYMPRLAGNSGDNPESPGEENHRDRWQSVTELQYARFAKWAEGKFETKAPAPASDAHQQTKDLTFAALQWTTGAPLYPGIETNWIVWDPNLYVPCVPTSTDPKPEAIFRFNDKVKAGDLTKGLSLPWQSDFYECNTHWWPHIRPDRVLTEKMYQEVKGDSLITPKILPRNLTERALWDRNVNYDDGDDFDGAAQMVKKWNKLGFIAAVNPNEAFPIFVETERTLAEPTPSVEYNKPDPKSFKRKP